MVHVRHSRDLRLPSINGTVVCIEYSVPLVSNTPFYFFRKPPLTTIILLADMQSRRPGNSVDSRASGSASTNVPISARAARIGLILGQGGSELARQTSEEEADGAFSIRSLPLEYIVLQLSSLPQGCIRTAGTLEVFFHFLILVGAVRIG